MFVLLVILLLTAASTRLVYWSVEKLTVVNHLFLEVCMKLVDLGVSVLRTYPNNYTLCMSQKWCVEISCGVLPAGGPWH